MELIPVEGKTASVCAGEKFSALVGRRFRFEPTPNALTRGLEEVHLEGELLGAKKMLSYLETQAEDFSRDDMLAAMHLYVMDLNNHVVRSFNKGELITDVSHFTDKYTDMQQQNFDREVWE